MVFKHIGRKLRYAKKLKENKMVPLWVVIRKFGRIVSPKRLRIKRHWRKKKISL